jgi:hypothetical protein
MNISMPLIERSTGDVRRSTWVPLFSDQALLSWPFVAESFRIDVFLLSAPQLVSERRSIVFGF